MNNNNNNVSSSGIGFCELLAIVFIILKLLNKITWSWLWVLSPLWIPIAFVMVLFLLGFVFYFFGIIISAIIDRRGR